MFGEAAVLDDGRQIITPWKSGGVFIGGRFVPGPELRMPDATLDSKNRVWIVAKSQIDDRVLVMLDEGSRTWWSLPKKGFGSRTIIRADGSGVRVALTTSAAGWASFFVAETGVMVPLATGVVPGGAGATGMRDWIGNTPRPLTPLDQTLQGYKVRALVVGGPTTIACNIDSRLVDSVLLVQGNQPIGTLALGQIDWPTPRVSPNGRYWVGVDYARTIVRGGLVPLKTPPLVSVPPPVVIPPDPQPEPPKPPMSSQITFQSANGLFLCAEEGGNDQGLVTATRKVAGPWETFTRFIQPDGRFVYMSANGRYLCAEDGGGQQLRCNRTVAGPWENFREIAIGGGVALQSDNGHYVCAEGGGGGEVNVSRGAAGPWETFNVPAPLPPGSVTPLHPDGHVFRNASGTAFRWKGVSAFQLADRFTRGEDLTPFLRAYQGYNTLRVWSYTEGPNWTDPAWGSPTPAQAVAFVQAMNAAGWYVEWTLLTSSNPARQADALAQIEAFRLAALSGLFLEATNEPEVQHDGIVINAEPLRAALEGCGYPYCNGFYKDARKHWGTYFTTHTQRDAEWPRRSHDALDIYNPPADAPPGTPAKKMPIILDEPAKLQDVGGDRVGDWKAYFASGSFFGAGVTFHSQTGKFAQPPTAEEAQLAAAGLVGLNAFPEEAPGGAYSRVDDSTLRTYIVGDSSVRIRPTTPNHPRSGWSEIDSAHILYRR